MRLKALDPVGCGTDPDAVASVLAQPPEAVRSAIRWQRDFYTPDTAVVRCGPMVSRRLGIGRRVVPQWRISDKPVRIVVGAFAAGQPNRDLLLSPDHAMFFDGALIPIKYLLNGDTVHHVPAREVT